MSGSAPLDEGRLKKMALRLLDVQEAERRRIAAQLHDDVGQLLTALKLTLSMPGADGDGSGPGDTVAEARELVEALLERVRDLQLDLRPAMLDDLGLRQTLEWYLERAARRGGVALDLDLAGIDRTFDPRLADACFRVVQEAVSNVLRHAGARRLAVGARASGGELVLEIADDGRGFDAQAALSASRDGRSAGLGGMEERLALLGGDLEIESGDGRGSRVRATLPLDQAPDIDGGKSETG